MPETTSTPTKLMLKRRTFSYTPENMPDTLDDIMDLEADSVTEETFDRNGLVITSEITTADYQLIQREEFKYTINGMLCDRVLHKEVEDNPEHQVLLYDPKNRLIKDETTYDGGAVVTKTLRYDDTARTMESFTIGSEDGFEEHCFEKRDANGNIVEEIEYDVTGAITSHKRNTYNAANNLLKTEELNAKDAWVMTYEAAYDTSGNLIEESFYDENGRRIDHAEHWRKGTQTTEVSTEETIQTTLDDLGNLIEEKHFDKDHNILTSVLNFYDEDSNLIGSISVRFPELYYGGSSHGRFVRSNPSYGASIYEYEWY